MLDIDKRNPEQIAKLICWVQRDEFEMANVRSMDKLRTRFDQLALKREHSNTNGRAARKVPVITGSAVENTLALLEVGAQ